jgi:hypothetical protein
MTFSAALEAANLIDRLERLAQLGDALLPLIARKRIAALGGPDLRKHPSRRYRSPK